MAKRYEISVETWGVVADCFTENHIRARPRASHQLMLNGLLFLARMLRCEICRSALGPGRRFRGWRNQETFDQMLRRSSI